MKKDNLVGCLVNDEKKQEILDAANKEERSISSFVRRAIDDYMRRIANDTKRT
jgi:hypothetical protein